MDLVFGFIKITYEEHMFIFQKELHGNVITNSNPQEMGHGST
jgi:hypothetical protein